MLEKIYFSSRPHRTKTDCSRLVSGTNAPGNLTKHKHRWREDEVDRNAVSVIFVCRRRDWLEHDALQERLVCACARDTRPSRFLKSSVQLCLFDHTVIQKWLLSVESSSFESLVTQSRNGTNLFTGFFYDTDYHGQERCCHPNVLYLPRLHTYRRKTSRYTTRLNSDEIFFLCVSFTTWESWVTRYLCFRPWRA